MVIYDGAIVYAYSNKIKNLLDKTPEEVCAVQIDLLKENSIAQIALY